jgi:hypothetical protein
MAIVARSLENEALRNPQSCFRSRGKEMGRTDRSLKVHHLTGLGQPVKEVIMTHISTTTAAVGTQ